MSIKAVGYQGALIGRSIDFLSIGPAQKL